MKLVFLYSRGNGNDGDFPRGLVELKEGDSQYAALRALVVNDMEMRTPSRRHILKALEVDGEAGDYGVYGTIHEGPKGEKDMGAAWLTAELKPLDKKKIAELQARDPVKYTVHPIRSLLDETATRQFRAWNRTEKIETPKAA